MKSMVLGITVISNHELRCGVRRCEVELVQVRNLDLVYIKDPLPKKRLFCKASVGETC